MILPIGISGGNNAPGIRKVEFSRHRSFSPFFQRNISPAEMLTFFFFENGNLNMELK